MKNITFVFALVAGFVFAAAPTFAQTYQSFYSYASGSNTTCTNLTQNLSVGSRSGEVTQLQSFLADRNYPGGGNWMVTGYFGAATRAAVRNFQQEMGLVQTGALDAPTRSAISRVSCGGTSYVPNYQSQYPYLYTSNNQSYPFNNYNYNNTYPYAYNYNNNTYPYTYTNNNNTGCNTNYAYGSAGWYQYNNCNSTNGTNMPISISYITPMSGAVGNSVTVFGTGFSTNGNTVHFGLGIIANLNSIDGRSVSFTVPSQLTGYGSQVVYLGAYNVSVTNAAGQSSGVVPFTVTSLGNAGTPSITNVSGPTSLNTGTNGTWTLQVYNPGSNYLSVNVNWGDQNVYPYASQQAAQTIYSQGTQTLTFGHTYQTVGNYTITFTATNANGASVISTATVYVSGSNTNNGGTPTISYLSPTAGQVGTSVTIYGTNFSQWGNTVRFGNGAITNVSSNGSMITFTVPGYLSPYCAGNVVCPMYAQMVTPGAYPVSVINGTGITSNGSIFTVQ